MIVRNRRKRLENRATSVSKLSYYYKQERELSFGAFSWWWRRDLKLGLFCALYYNVFWIWATDSQVIYRLFVRAWSERCIFIGRKPSRVKVRIGLLSGKSIVVCQGRCVRARELYIRLWEGQDEIIVHMPYAHSVGLQDCRAHWLSLLSVIQEK